MRSTPSAFEAWMRSGRWPAYQGTERKFNPWHDPSDGRFTFAGQGRYFGPGGSSQRRAAAGGLSRAPVAASPAQERTRTLRQRAQAEAAAAAERRRIVLERREQEAFKRHMIPDEGDENEVYLDTTGNPTVGIGHKVTPADGLKLGDHISDAQKEAFWRNDSRQALDAARRQMREARITQPNFLSPLASVNFQLGPGWRDKFPKTWDMIKSRRYADAAVEAEDSDWFRLQTPRRVRAFQAALMQLEKAEQASRQRQRRGPTSVRR